MNDTYCVLKLKHSNKYVSNYDDTSIFFDSDIMLAKKFSYNLNELKAALKIINNLTNEEFNIYIISITDLTGLIK